MSGLDDLVWNVPRSWDAKGLISVGQFLAIRGQGAYSTNTVALK